MIKKCLKAFYVGLILLLLYAPILLLAVYSFNEVDTLGPMGEFSSNITQSSSATPPSSK